MYVDGAEVNDLKKYFARPVNIATIPYNSATRGLLATYELDSVNTRIRVRNFDRIEGCFGWRATFCFRIQAVATPFQGGRVRLAFQPFSEYGALFPRLSRITPISQLPGVELDLAESTSAILKVPFIFPKNYFTYAPSATDSLGRVGLYAYTPVVLAPGATSPSIAVWHWLEDVELIGAAPARIVNFQAGKMSKNASSAEESAIPGNLSNVLAAGAKLTSWLGNKIPMISSYAGPTSWMMREAAKIASSYGWAKPINTAPVMRMIQTENVYQQNADGVDTTYSLGAMIDNAIQPLPGFAGSDVDEMSIAYVKGVYSAISAPTFSTTNVPGNIIYACQLTPGALFFQDGNTNTRNSISSPSNSAIWPSSLFGLANCFRMWRGGIKFRIKMSKTKFHTGRLLLGFTSARPANTPLGVPVPVDLNSMEFKSAIWDLREGNVMEFTCPFICPQSFLTLESYFGGFHISVVEPLQGPDTVSSTIPFVVEVAGAEDFEFAFPNTPERFAAPLNSLFVAQAGNFEVFQTDPTVDQAASCIGEKFNSIKQLIGKACYTRILFAGEINIGRHIVVPTWSSGTGGNLNNLNPSWRGYFNFFYGLERGGLCYHVTNVGANAVISGHVGNNAVPSSLICNTAIMEPVTALHVKVPFYTSVSRIPTSDQNYGQEAFLRINYSPGSTTSTTALLQERAADDFQYGYYLGPPPLARYSGVALPLSETINALQRTARS